MTEQMWGDHPVTVSDIVDIRVIKRADDPISPTRVSIGSIVEGEPGHENLIGHYCTYRGTKEDAIAALERCVAALKALPREPAIEPDIPGKRYL